MFSRYHGLHSTIATATRTAMSLCAAAAASGALWATAIATSNEAGAKTPGKTYCFVRKCHRVLTLEETRRAVGQTKSVFASHYGPAGQDRFNPSNVTSSGEYYRAGAADNAASPTLPNGTVILAWNPATKQSVVLRINNAGPYWGNRTLDVSRGAAQRLGFASKGVASLRIKVLRAPSQSEASFKRGRRYAAVPGPIGAHASIEQAAAAASRAMGGSAPSAPAVAPVMGPTVVAAGRPVHAPMRPVAPAPASSVETASAPAAPVTDAVMTAAATSQPSFIIGSGARTKQRPPRATRRTTVASGGRAPECQGWVGSCTVSAASGAGSRTRVALSVSNR